MKQLTQHVNSPFWQANPVTGSLHEWVDVTVCKEYDSLRMTSGGLHKLCQTLHKLVLH